MGLILLTIASCELFTTREPEPPSGGETGGWKFPTMPEVALDNLESAIGRRSPADYGRIFSAPENGLPEYHFEPDPTTAASNPGAFEQWNLDRERRHAQALFNPSVLPLDSIALLELTTDRQTQIGDSASFTCSYKLHIGHREERTPREMEGRADFRMLRAGDGGWYIEEWADLRAPEKPCWSDLKAAF